MSEADTVKFSFVKLRLEIERQKRSIDRLQHRVKKKDPNDYTISILYIYISMYIQRRGHPEQIYIYSSQFN